jgi:hypothetical protein
VFTYAAAGARLSETPDGETIKALTCDAVIDNNMLTNQLFYAILSHQKAMTGNK